MKYIIVDTMGLEVPILFSELLNHSDVARGYKVVAAGFVSISSSVDTNDSGYSPKYIIEVDCYGESTTLGIKSRGILDDDIIDDHLYLCI